MRFVVFALVAAVTALAQGPRPLNPPSLSPNFHGWDAAPVERIPTTNAERFARGLPPLSPKSRRRHHAHLAATRVRSAPRSETSPGIPVLASCNILVSSTDGTPLGYVSPSWNDYGEYGALQATQTGALVVSFSYPVNSPYQLTLVAMNSPSANYPNFGAVAGYSADQNEPKFGPGEYNYAYIAGTLDTPVGAVPQKGSNSYTSATGLDAMTESAIWTYDSATGAITAQWINPDGSAPATQVAIVSGVLILTGDVEVLSANLQLPVDAVNFKCVSPVLSPP